MSSKGFSQLLVVSVICLSFGTFSVGARAETLADALADAYNSSPSLQLQRSQLRITNEAYVQAGVSLRPTVTVSASAGYQREDFGAGGGATTTASGAFIISGGSGSAESNSGGAQVTITQPLYTGGRTTAALRAAKAAVDADREGLRAAEADILFSTVQAYLDVLRDQQTSEIRRRNVEVLLGQLDLTRGRFDVGDLTRTDVAEAEAQLAAARALLSSAKGQLESSNAVYQAVVGHSPGTLDPPPTLPGLPNSADQAFDDAMQASPALMKAVATEQSSREKLAQAKAAQRPTVSLQGTYGYEGALAPFETRDYNGSVTATVTVSQSIFTGGLNQSNTRIASEQNNSDRLSIEIARRQIVQNTAQAWSAIASLAATEASSREQFRAASIAFEGAREEYKVGKRTTLDILVAQEKVSDAELSQVQTAHDAYVVKANLLRVIGRLEARFLLEGLELHNPAEDFDRIKHAGATPWDGVVRTIDAIGAPKALNIRSAPPPASPTTAVTMAPLNR